MDAKTVLQQGNYSCVVSKEVVIFAVRGIGVKPLLNAYDRYPDSLNGAFIADKVIGKAAAIFALLGGAKEVYGQVMSQAADQFLTARGLPHSYGTMVPFIENRTKDGICPIEQSVLSLSDPLEGLAEIRTTIAALMAK